MFCIVSYCPNVIFNIDEQTLTGIFHYDHYIENTLKVKALGSVGAGDKKAWRPGGPPRLKTFVDIGANPQYQSLLSGLLV